jgi:hypothetical protein
MSRTASAASGPASERVCAWCGGEIDERTRRRARGGAFASHGLCRGCSWDLLRSLAADGPAPLTVAPRRGDGGSS